MRKIFFLLAALFLSLSINGNAKNKTAFAHDLAIATIFQNEARFLKEWIEYHLLLGVQKFYLYNNCSQDDYLTVLQPYMKKGVVELIEWPYESSCHTDWVPIQLGALRDAAIRTAGLYNWLALIDADEFIVPHYKDNLIDFLKDYEEYGGIGINWLHFGSAGCEKIPSGKLMIECLNKRARKGYPNNTFVKTILHPHLVLSFPSAHYALLKPGAQLVSASHKFPFSGERLRKADFKKIQINHYFCRDLLFYKNVKYPRRQKWFQHSWEDLLHTLEDFNKIEDSSISRFIPRLRKKMKL